MIELILGIAVIAIIFVVMSLSLDNEHIFLKLFLFASVFTILYLVPSVVVGEVCEEVVNNATVSGDTTTYTYTSYCYAPNQSDTDTTFFVYYSWIWRIFWAYILVYGIYKLFQLPRFNTWFQRTKFKMRRKK